MCSKIKQLTESMEVFEFSNKDAGDIMQLFQTIVSVTGPDAGLSWSEVRNVVEKHLDKYGVPIV